MRLQNSTVIVGSSKWNFFSDHWEQDKKTFLLQIKYSSNAWKPLPFSYCVVQHVVTKFIRDIIGLLRPASRQLMKDEDGNKPKAYVQGGHNWIVPPQEWRQNDLFCYKAWRWQYLVGQWGQSNFLLSTKLERNPVAAGAKRPWIKFPAPSEAPSEHLGEEIPGGFWGTIKSA